MGFKAGKRTALGGHAALEECLCWLLHEPRARKQSTVSQPGSIPCSGPQCPATDVFACPACLPAAGARRATLTARTAGARLGRSAARRRCSRNGPRREVPGISTLLLAGRAAGAPLCRSAARRRCWQSEGQCWTVQPSLAGGRQLHRASHCWHRHVSHPPHLRRVPSTTVRVVCGTTLGLPSRSPPILHRRRTISRAFWRVLQIDVCVNALAGAAPVPGPRLGRLQGQDVASSARPTMG